MALQEAYSCGKGAVERPLFSFIEYGTHVAIFKRYANMNFLFLYGISIATCKACTTRAYEVEESSHRIMDWSKVGGDDMALCKQQGPHTCPFASCDHDPEPESHRTTVSDKQVQALADFTKKRGGWINTKSMAIILELTMQGVSPAEAFEKSIEQVFGR